MLAAPAMAPAIPASRTTFPPTLLPAKPITRDTFDTSPSLMPKTAARARPPDTDRCPACCSAGMVKECLLTDSTLVQSPDESGRSIPYQGRRNVPIRVLLVTTFDQNVEHSVQHVISRIHVLDPISFTIEPAESSQQFP
jgi:hypothetical protein